MFGLSVTVAGVAGPLYTVHKVSLWQICGGPTGYYTQSVTVAM